MPKQQQKNDTIFVDLGDEYDSQEVLEAIENTYGKVEAFKQVSLHRLQSDGRYSLLKKYQELPELETIIKNYGGGDYKLFLQWLDPESPGKKYIDRRHIQTRLFSIEGNSITPKYGDDQQQQNPEQKRDSVDELIRLKNAGLFGNGNGENTSMALILKSLENQNALMLKMLEINSGGKDETAMMKYIMPLVLKNNETDLDKIIKYKDVLFAGGGAADDGLSLTKLAGPIMQMLTNRGGGAADDGTIKQMLINLTKQTQIIIENVNEIIADHNRLEERFNTLEDDYYIDDPDDPGDETTKPVQNEISGKNPNLMNKKNSPGKNKPVKDAQVITDLNFDDNFNNVNSNQINNDMVSGFKKQLKTATEDDKIEVLRQWLFDLQTPNEVIKKFCLDTGLAKDAADYDKYKKLAEEKQKSKKI